MLSKPARLFRRMSIIEGWSFVVLLIFGSLLSRISDIDLVRPLGYLHAVLFIALVVVIFTVQGPLGWSKGTTLAALVAAVLPLGPFVFDYAKRDQLRAASEKSDPGSTVSV